MKKYLALLLTVCLTAACAAAIQGTVAGTAPVKVVGGILTSSEMSLYVFDQDRPNSGRSECSGPCAGKWPPLYATPDDQSSGSYSIIPRDDGRRQWAYAGKPLYLWSGDRRPGERTGDGVNGQWRLARP